MTLDRALLLAAMVALKEVAEDRMDPEVALEIARDIARHLGYPWNIDL